MGSKRGIALLITLAFITALSFLIAASFEIGNKNYERVAKKRILIQSSVGFSDVKSVLDYAVKDVKDGVGLDILMNTPLAMDDGQSGFALFVKFSSAARKPNINTIINNNQINQKLYDFIDGILQKNEIVNRELFFAVLFDAISPQPNGVERQPNSSLAKTDRLFKTGQIQDMQRFELILSRYKALAKDEKIDNIDWKNIIGFSGSAIDFNYIQPEFLSAALPSLTDGAIKELTADRLDVYKDFNDAKISTEDGQKLKDLGVVFYVPMVHCDVDFRQNNTISGFSFDYDIKSKKASNFEIAL